MIEEVTFINSIITYRGNNYYIGGVESSSDISTIVNLVNEPYTFNIVLIANQTAINGVLQTSPEMIVETLSS
jgi:hypothetical protein